MGRRRQRVTAESRSWMPGTDISLRSCHTCANWSRKFRLRVGMWRCDGCDGAQIREREALLLPHRVRGWRFLKLCRQRGRYYAHHDLALFGVHQSARLGAW